jgi:hypothetical protein
MTEAASPQRRFIASLMLLGAAFWYGIALVAAALFVWMWSADGLHAAGFAAPLFLLSLAAGVGLTLGAVKAKGRKEL